MMASWVTLSRLLAHPCFLLVLPDVFCILDLQESVGRVTILSSV